MIYFSHQRKQIPIQYVNFKTADLETNNNEQERETENMKNTNVTKQKKVLLFFLFTIISKIRYNFNYPLFIN